MGEGNFFPLSEAETEEQFIGVFQKLPLLFNLISLLEIQICFKK